MHKALEDKFADAKDVVFMHIQTVWEGTHTNTPLRGPREVRKYEIKAPTGFDAHVDGARTSIMMGQYGTGGTPWTLVIGKDRLVHVSQVTPTNVAQLAETIQKLREPKR